MFAEIPKLLDKDFAIGYFLPVAIFSLGNILLLNFLGLGGISQVFSSNNPLIGTTMIGLLSWVGGILLMVTNREIVRILEGYGNLNFFSIFKWMETREYRKIQKAIDEAENTILDLQENDIAVPPEVSSRRREMMLMQADQFPTSERWLMPTRFGNVIRSFETYSGQMYGLEAIQGWNKLVGVIPAEFMSQINSAKASVDFWVNLGVLGFLFYVESATLIVALHSPKSTYFFPIIGLIIAWIAAYRATSVAIGWGELVKSAFDLYRIDLANKLGFIIPTDKDEARAAWNHYSQAIVYRLPEVLPNSYQKPPDEEGEK